MWMKVAALIEYYIKIFRGGMVHMNTIKDNETYYKILAEKLYNKR